MRFQTQHTLKQNNSATISRKMESLLAAFWLTVGQNLLSDSRLSEGNDEVCDYRPGGVLHA